MSAIVSRLIIKSITRVVKNTSKFDIVVDDLIDKFKSSCPPKPELLRIVANKSQIQTALSNLTDSINSLNQAAETTNALISSLNIAVKVIKTLPFPVSTPPGIGIPVRVITILADSLDSLGKLLDGAEGTVKIVPVATKVIVDAVTNILTKLTKLDEVINACVEELAEEMTQLEKNQLISEIGNSAATSGDFSNLEINVANEDELIARLDINSNDPIFYKTFKLYIKYNSDNDFDFPQRRLVGYRAARESEPRDPEPWERNLYNLDDDSNAQIVTYVSEQYLGNQLGGGYSYISSVKVMLDELKFRIDVDANRWQRRLVNLDLATVEGLDEPFQIPKPPTIPNIPFG